MSPPSLRTWLGRAPFGLTMSSGFFGFFAHTGMLRALLEAGLEPHRVSGASAGGMVGALWASGLSVDRLADELMGLTREAFWDPAPGFGVLRGARFRGLLESLLPVLDFASTRVPVAVSAFEVPSFARAPRDALRAGRTVAFTEGALAPAIHATCAVPFMFQPVRIGRRHYLDGGILDRPGLVGMPAGQRVLYHHLTSRSPWRRARSPALRIPQRPGLVALAIHDLPRSSPFALGEGRRALELAYQRTRTALDLPIVDDVVRV